MNFMHVILSSKRCDDDKINKKLDYIDQKIKTDKIKITNNFTKIGNSIYYLNCLPVISDKRDVLKKPNGIINIRINWKNKDFGDISTNEICNQLKLQYGWCVSTVDVEHTRNNFKNKEVVWVIFDNKDTAEKYMRVFNLMFRTAIEQDAIDEYRRFKQNPTKRVLTFDKLIENAHELYEEVDKE